MSKNEAFVSVAMNVQQVLFFLFSTAFYLQLVAIIPAVKLPPHLKPVKRNVTKPNRTYDLSSRYNGNNGTMKKNVTNRYCFLKEKVESTYPFDGLF